MMAALVTVSPRSPSGLYQGDLSWVSGSSDSRRHPEDRIRLVRQGRSIRFCWCDGSRTHARVSRAPQQGFTTGGSPGLPDSTSATGLLCGGPPDERSRLPAQTPGAGCLHWRRNSPPCTKAMHHRSERREPLLASCAATPWDAVCSAFSIPVGAGPTFHPYGIGLVRLPLNPPCDHGLNAFGEDHVVGGVLRCRPYEPLCMEAMSPQQHGGRSR